MGLLTDFFVASEDELQAAFPHRYPVAAKPTVKKAKNPFTGEPITVQEWNPAKPFPKKTVPVPRDEEFRAVQRLPLAQFKNVDNVKLAQLYCVLTGAEFSDVIGDLGRPALVAPDDETTPLFRLPADWIKTVAGIDKLPAVAKAWAATEECQADGFTAKDTKEVAEALRALARKAIADGKGMFLWMNV